MIYFLGLIVGFLNGFFSSGAGQVLVFYLIFIKKKDTHKSRTLSVFLLTISSIVSLIFLLNFKELKILDIAFLILSSLVFGGIGTRIMQKIDANILNFISGSLILILSIIRFINLGSK